MKNPGFLHRRINHTEASYVRGGIHANSVEGFWSLIKRGIGGTYHSCDRQLYRELLGSIGVPSQPLQGSAADVHDISGTDYSQRIRSHMPPKDEEPEQSQQPKPDPPSQDDSTERERLLDPELDYLRKHSERIIEKRKS